MNKDITFTIAPTKTAPTSGIERVEPTHVPNFAKCEANINLGLFFDGTKNNYDADRKKLKHSNVARLLAAYFEEKSQGCYRQYVPGVGTPFPEIGEEGESDLGSGFAIGCEERVLFGLLRVFNAIHEYAFKAKPFFSKAQVKALCCNTSGMSATIFEADRDELAKLGQFGGLRVPNNGGTCERDNILRALAGRLAEKLIKGRPNIKECFIDVFGFSRGAASARVFCSWLDRLLDKGKLAGVIVHIRFLGIMDTVASAGFWSSVSAATIGTEGGHSGWADAQFLRIPASVRYCVHMVAMHELRKNFPLDTVTVDGVLPPNCREFAYPGSHSDVGGGYLPDELGISVGKDQHESDALKLAQIPLNHMLECARAAGVPVNKTRAFDPEQKHDPFVIAPRLQAAYDQFLDLATMTPRPVHEWLQPYLTWRWDRRLVYTSLAHVRRASEAERELLIKFNDYLLQDVALLERAEKTSAAVRVVNLLRFSLWDETKADALRMLAFDAEASAVLKKAKQTLPDNRMIFHTLFDEFVHDSLAGFNRHSIELTGHWRYRKGFLGSVTHRIVSNDTLDAVSGRA